MRCSAYAVHVATAMCDGNLEEALELAVGRPRAGDRIERPEAEWRHELPHLNPTQAEMEQAARLDEERQVRIRHAPLTTVATALTRLTVEWLARHRDRLHNQVGIEVANALAIVSWDAFLIGGKIHRALDGRDRSAAGELPDEDPVQNDWNGSAKVALISIERSAAAWDVVAAATGDREASRLAGEMRSFAREVERAFPDAWRFLRPGFDSPDSAAQDPAS